MSDREIGGEVVYFAVDEDDPILQKPRVYIVRSFADARLLDDNGHQIVHSLIHKIAPHRGILLIILEQVHVRYLLARLHLGLGEDRVHQFVFLDAVLQIVHRVSSFILGLYLFDGE